MATKNETKPAAPAPPTFLPAEMPRLEKLAKLRELFPSAAYGLLPKALKKDSPKGNCDVCKGYHGLPAIHLDYIGHATVTDRLLTVDPDWNWEPLAFDEHGLPRFTRLPNGQAVGLWGKVTILGVTRLGYGSVEPGAFEPEKQLIGDFLRNACMRFGVGLELWSKAELESAALSNSHAIVDPKSGEMKPVEQPHPPAKPAAKPDAAKAPEKPQDAPKERPNPGPWTPPEWAEDGSAVVFGVPVASAVTSGWDIWRAEKPVNAATSKSAVKGMPWSEIVQGPYDGGRHNFLRWAVCNGQKELAKGDPLSMLSQRATWALHLFESNAARTGDNIGTVSPGDAPLQGAELFSSKG